ncbi:MAG: type II secretion system F family protein [Candidatus Woesearchaeota archaeon]|nr:MAG: type II secretion system F family protein [Candidatus Woesearchaeota archaeon]
MNKKKKEELLKELNLSESDLKRFIKKNKKQKETIEEVIEKGYTIYKVNRTGKIANYFFEHLSDDIIRKYPHLFERLFDNLKLSGIKLLSRTYLSIILFFTSLGFLVGLLGGILIFLNGGVLSALIKGLAAAIFFAVLVFFIAYIYPGSLAKSRSKKMKSELPFVILHMSAVAGSGAQPAAVFKLIAESDEYPELSGEVKKIVNYINLFGYDLTTALRAVNLTTPSLEFKELLNGMIANVESGGDLKDYLKNKADDSLRTYKLDRKKYVEGLAIYSDIYTGVLIAAPLLFLVSLAIINVIGGDLFGLSINLIASVGAYVVLPILNILFLMFVNLMQPTS